MKTKEEILIEKFPSAKSLDWYKPICEAMEEYASQSKTYTEEQVRELWSLWESLAESGEIAVDRNFINSYNKLKLSIKL